MSEFIFCACGFFFIGGSALPHFRARAVIVCFRVFAFPLLGVPPVFASRFLLVLASAVAFMLLCSAAFLLLCLPAALL